MNTEEEVYFGISVDLSIVTMQWFDEPDYSPNVWLIDEKFESEAEAISVRDKYVLDHLKMRDAVDQYMLVSFSEVGDLYKTLCEIAAGMAEHGEELIYRTPSYNAREMRAILESEEILSYQPMGEYFGSILTPSGRLWLKEI